MTPPRNILFVSTQMEAGGVQVRATKMLAKLRAEGYNARMVFLYMKRPTFTGKDGVYALAGNRPKTPLAYLRILWRFFRHVRTERPDAIVGFAHFASPLAALAGLLAGAKRRIGTQANPPGTVGRVAQALDWLVGSCGIYTTNIAASRSTMEYFERYPRRYRAGLRAVLNGVALEPSRLTPAEARVEFSLPTDRFLILNTGRLSKEKNQSFLLEVLRLLPNVHLAILGEGDLRNALTERAKELGVAERLTLLGEIAPSRVTDFLRAGDAFVFPSLFEAFGLAVVEAMLAGLPIVATAEPGLREVVGTAGRLLPLENPALWAEAIAKLRDDPELRSVAAAEAAARGRVFSFDQMLAGFKDALGLPTEPGAASTDAVST